MKPLLFILALATLTACAPAPAPQFAAPAPDLSDAAAIRRVEGLTETASAYTATAGAVATVNANATAVRVREEQLLRDKMTQDAHTLAMQATSGALTGTPAVATAQAGATTTAAILTATREATIEAQQAQIAAVELENSKQWGETSRAIFWAVTVVVSIAVTLFVGWGIVTLKLFAQAENERRADRHEIEMMKLKLAAFAQAMRETRAGTVVPMLDGPPMVLPPAGVTSGSAISDLPETPPIVVNDGDDSHTISRMTPAEIQAQAEVLEWVRLSIDWHNAQGKAGHREHQLKRWSAIGKDSEFQKRVTAYLGESIIVGGAGTFAAGGITLGELYRRVKAGEISLCVAQATHTHTAQYSTAQAEI